ncbi:MAG: lysine--tRNA ligase, partial [Chloroflexi bacterium]
MSGIRELHTTGQLEANAVEFTEQQAVRLEKVRALRESGIEPYPLRAERTHTSLEAIAHYEAVEARLADGRDATEVVVVGRVMAFRDMGRSTFAHLEDGEGRIQIYLRANVLGREAYEHAIKFIDLGDFLEARGHLFRTRTGEVTLEVTGWRFLAKAITPPPEKWHGLADVETRYRQRYADLFSNPEVRKIFVTRTRIISAIRRFLDSEGFLEVETPTLQPVYGGAAARPFTTYHNALDQ